MSHYTLSLELISPALHQYLAQVFVPERIETKRLERKKPTYETRLVSIRRLGFDTLRYST